MSSTNFRDTYTPKPITDVFTEDTSIDRRQCKREVPMKVLALGMGRTGTVSLRAALKRLGYQDTYHMMCASVENPPDCLMWSDAFAAKYDGKGEWGREQWDQLLGHCQAVCDWPACAFAPELIEAYPEAKIIITTRDVDSWHKSVMKTVYWRVMDPEFRIVHHFSWGAGMYYPMLKKMFDTFFKGDFPNKGKECFQEHYAEVRKMVKPENLLEYNISDGWEPLCKFLGEPIPFGVDFPRSNDAHGFVQRTKTRNRMQMLQSGLRGILIGTTLAATSYALYLGYQKYFSGGVSV
ncbi:MAG: hypothetical protein M1834_003084 [Cirrosporium novae-zelandiae]|nr:MAG: hypothetical protein M1834_003084 [Cirrosporium novae-zelandiae]